MPIVCWGALGKAANDPTTIDQEIMAYVAAHDADINAHGLNGYAINVHRSDSPLDHIDYSVTSDKLTIDQIVGKDFRTDEDVGPGRDGVMFNPFGISMYQAGVRKVYIPTSGDAEFLGSVTVNTLRFLVLYIQTTFESMDAWINMNTPWTRLTGGTIGHRIFASAPVIGYHARSYLLGEVVQHAKNPFFEVDMIWEASSNGFGYVSLGDLSSEDVDEVGFGFAEIKGATYAMAQKVSNHYSVQFRGVNMGQRGIYRGEINKQTGTLSFFVNGHLYATLPDPGLLNFTECTFMIDQYSTQAFTRVMNFYRIAFGNLLP